MVHALAPRRRMLRPAFSLLLKQMPEYTVSNLESRAKANGHSVVGSIKGGRKDAALHNAFLVKLKESITNHFCAWHPQTCSVPAFVQCYRVAAAANTTPLYNACANVGASKFPSAAMVVTLSVQPRTNSGAASAGYKCAAANTKELKITCGMQAAD